MTDTNDFLYSCLDNNLCYEIPEIGCSETSNTANTANTTNTVNTANTVKTANTTNTTNTTNTANTSNTANTAKSNKQLNTQSNAISYIPVGNNNIYITKSGAFIKFEYLSKDPTNLLIVNKILKYFTMRKKQIIGYDKTVKCYKLDKINKRLILPRFGIFEILHNEYNLKNYTTISQIVSGQTIDIKWEAKLTDNQKIISDYIINNIYTKERVSKGSAGLILNLEAGQGKSYLAAYMISVLKKKTVIIMHSTSLLLQWEKVIKNCFRDVKLGYYYNQTKLDGDIVLMIINSALSDVFKFADKQIPALEYYNSFGFAIYDECHLYANNFCNKVFKLAQTEYVLGLSATPDENINGFDKMVWWELGPVLDARTLPGYSATSENFNAEVHKICYNGPPEYTRNIVNEVTEMCLFSSMINMICSDLTRSFIVVDCIKQGLALGLYMYVFADRRQYLLELKDILKYSTGINGEIIDNEDDYIRIVGGASDEAMEQAELKSRVVFTTYQYMGTGKSIIKMNGLVLATPRKSKMKQYINRIFRLGSDTTIKRHIWDICDSKTKFNNLWRTRNLYYKSKNYDIFKTTIDYSEYDKNTIEIYKKKQAEQPLKRELEQLGKQTEQPLKRELEQTAIHQENKLQLEERLRQEKLEQIEQEKIINKQKKLLEKEKQKNIDMLKQNIKRPIVRTKKDNLNDISSTNNAINTNNITSTTGTPNTNNFILMNKK